MFLSHPEYYMYSIVYYPSICTRYRNNPNIPSKFYGHNFPTKDKINTYLINSQHVLYYSFLLRVLTNTFIKYSELDYNDLGYCSKKIHKNRF